MISKTHNAKTKDKAAHLYLRKDFMTEKEIRKLMEEIIRETNISELCTKEGIDAHSYFKWSKEFIEITRKKLEIDFDRATISSEIHQLKNENLILSKLVAELSDEVRNMKRRLVISA